MVIRPRNTEVRIRCKYCKEYTQTIGPIQIQRFRDKEYHIYGKCLVCNKNKHKLLNQSQIDILPPELKDMTIGSTISQSIERDGGVVPILGVIGE